MAHEMARVSDLLFEVLHSAVPAFTFPFGFVGHPGPGAFLRAPYHIVG